MMRNRNKTLHEEVTIKNIKREAWRRSFETLYPLEWDM